MNLNVRPEITGRAGAGAVAAIEPEDLVSSDETAKLLHVQSATLTAWRHYGRGLAFIKIGRRVFYRRADIAAWLGAQRRDPALVAA